MGKFNPPPDFAPNFSKGLVAAIAQDAVSGEILMLAWMNEEAWKRTLATGEAHYFSRSRQKLWRKGETSGHTQAVEAILLDCDQDAVVLKVRQAGGAACHTGHRSCFYRQLTDDKVKECAPLVFDAQKVYGSKADE